MPSGTTDVATVVTGKGGYGTGSVNYLQANATCTVADTNATQATLTIKLSLKCRTNANLWATAVTGGNYMASAYYLKSDSNAVSTSQTPTISTSTFAPGATNYTSTTIVRTYTATKTITKTKKEPNTYDTYYVVIGVGYSGSCFYKQKSIEIQVPPKPSYMVYYYANGGNTSSLPADQRKYYNENLTLTTSVPTRESYVFSKWNTSPGGSGTDYNPGGTYSSNAVMLLYAIWNPLVSFNANGGANAPSAQTKTLGTDLTITSSTPTRSMHVFKEWNTEADGTGTSYDPGDTYSVDEPVTLYAQWLTLPEQPTISSISAVRWNETTSEQDDLGTSARVSLDWAVDITSGYYGNNNTGTVTLAVSPNTVTSITPVSGTSGQSGTAVFMVSGVAMDQKYTITATVTDLNSSSTRSVILTKAHITMDLKAGGYSMGIGCTAPDIYTPVTDSTVPTFVIDKYYEKSVVENITYYELLNSEPSDWSTNWTDYYTCKHPNGLFKCGMDAEFNEAVEFNGETTFNENLNVDATIWTNGHIYPILNWDGTAIPSASVEKNISCVANNADHNWLGAFGTIVYPSAGGSRQAGAVASYMGARNIMSPNDTANYIFAFTNPDGTRGYSVSDASAFRSAIGLGGMGTIYSANKTVNTTANADSYVAGASITLPAGKYIVMAYGSFPSASTNGVVRVQLYNNTAGSTVATKGGYGSGWLSEQLIWMVGPSASTTYTTRISSSVARTSAPTYCVAIRII